MTTDRQLHVAGLRLDGVGPIDLSLARGECLVLSGPSGAGKSRLLRAIADLDPHQGRVCCQGTAAEDLAPCQWRRRVGMLAADGRCKAFDAAADGLVRGEGCGVVVLGRSLPFSQLPVVRWLVGALLAAALVLSLALAFDEAWRRGPLQQ